MAPKRHTRRAYVRERQKKRKKRRYIALWILAGMLVLGFVLLLVVQDHIVFTAEGMRFVFSKEEEPQRQEDRASVPEALPQPARGGFFPRVDGMVSVRSNGRPPYGAGYIDAQFVAVEDFSAEEAEDYASGLAASGVRSIVIDIKNENGRVNFVQNSVFSASAAALDGRLETFLARCAREGIRVTGRVCCFRDNDLPRRAGEYAVLTKNGEVYEDGDGYAWLDPYAEAVREGLASLCAQAAKLGVKEIWLDDFSFLGENSTQDVRLAGDADRVDSLNALLGSIRSALDERTVLSVSIYPDVLIEGGSDNKGLNLSDLAAVCGHLWIRCADGEEAVSYYQRAYGQSIKLADILCAVSADGCKSAALYLE